MLKYIFMLLLWLIMFVNLQSCTTGIILGTTAAIGGSATHIFNDRRHPDVQRMDGEVCGTIVESLKTDPTLQNNARIQVACFNKVVLLTGEAVSETVRQRIIQHAKLTHVRKINNEINIMKPINDLIQEEDGMIVTSIRAKLIGQTFLNASLVDVTVSNGVVYLMGLLTRDEARFVTDSVSRVANVRKVVSLIEYVNLVR